MRAETEHYGFRTLAPPFQVDKRWVVSVFLGPSEHRLLAIIACFGSEVVTELIEQGQLALQLTRQRLVTTGKLVLNLAIRVLGVHEGESCRPQLGDYHRRVLEVDSDRAVGQEVSQSVLRGVVDPPFNENFVPLFLTR